MKCAALVILVVGAVLVKDVLSASAEANSVPLLRKFSRNKGDASAKLESRGLFSISKPTKRPNSANVIFITSPSGPSDSEESEPSSPSAEPSQPSRPSRPSQPSWPSWPSWPHWPIYTTQKPSTTTTTRTTTTTTTPRPETRPPHMPPGDYPHYLPYPPPLLLPIPGWTGNPPPPFIHPSYQHRPQQHWPQWQEPPSWTPSEGLDDQAPSAPGTPTLATDDEIVNRDEIQDKDKDQGDLLWVPLQQDFNVNDLSPEILASLMGDKRKPQGNKKPKPNRRRPVTPSPIDTAAGNKRKPRPTRRRGPVRKLPAQSPANEQLPQMQPDNRRKPKPSRKPKPKPSAKPTQVTAKPEAAVAAEVSSEMPNTTVAAAVPPAVVSTESPTRKKTPTSKKPRPSRKPTSTTQAPAVVDPMSGIRNGPVKEKKEPLKKEPQAAPMPEPISTDEPEKSEQLPVSQMAGDMDKEAAAEAEPEDDDLDSTEFLGADEDLIVVQRRAGKPMDAQQVESGLIPPWQLLKLPRDSDWELGPQQRDDGPIYFFDG